ncbi:glycosyltransferase family 4 protein [Ornithinibacillus contaminans]|uniref:glycosyltransferase family 4 protein n=1 Tax=Ornithinibacillus contaminans TaxID=694055 RepID=UPI00064DD183|nr:glycosyltransferase family 4 protein [Ornithinibacillus contaminans]
MTFSEKYLILTNAYPSEDQLYRNGFIHRRVKSYEEYNADMEVFVLSPVYPTEESYVFDDVKVTRGNKEHFYNYLIKNDYAKILIHFVSPDMIETIKNVKPKIPLIIWIHGFEAEAWHRRWFNYLESREQLVRILEMSKNYYATQMKLMNYLYETDELDIKFIHVSKWFKEHIAEVDARSYSKNAYIIPNLIDEDFFNYQEKSPNHRLKILSIRPYASKKYANDQSVEAVLELANRPYFKRLHFAFYGDGKLFNETLAPLRNFSNVEIHKGFLKQDEIANLHKEYGVFLCPTRLDSQGVSMCESMSSGLVPLATNVTAIPEFVEHRYSGLLSLPENPIDIANNIEALYFNEELFLNLSKNAATSIREKCSKGKVITKEMELILS